MAAKKTKDSIAENTIAENTIAEKTTAEKTTAEKTTAEKTTAENTTAVEAVTEVKAAPKKPTAKKTEFIQLSPAQMAIYVAVFIGGTAFASALNWGSGAVKIRELQEKYDKLKIDYDNLKQDNETETETGTGEKYWKEYIVHEGDVIVEQRLNCSITIGPIYRGLEKAFIYSSKFGEDGKPETIEMKKAIPYDLTGKGDFFVVIKEFDDDSFTMIISEK